MGNRADMLAVAGRKLLYALNLPGLGAETMTSKRLTTIALDVEERERLMRAEHDFRAVLEADRSPWRDPHHRTASDRWVAVSQTFPSALADEDFTEMRIETIVARSGTNEVESFYGAGKGHVGRFMLSLLRMGKGAPFDVVAAMARWDEEHRHAFIAWAADPWWY